MVRMLHQITNTIKPWMNERLETLAGIYAAALKVCINDIVHALTMRSAVQRVRSGCVIACRCRLHLRNNLQPGYSCRPAA